jgi:hypothetical protein
LVEQKNRTSSRGKTRLKFTAIAPFQGKRVF